LLHLTLNFRFGKNRAIQARSNAAKMCEAVNSEIGVEMMLKRSDYQAAQDAQKVAMRFGKRGRAEINFRTIACRENDDPMDEKKKLAGAGNRFAKLQISRLVINTQDSYLQHTFTLCHDYETVTRIDLILKTIQDKIMVEKSHGPPPPGPKGPSPSDHKPHTPGEGFRPKPMTFLGMHFNSKQAEKLWQIIIQNVGREIDKLKAKSLKAIRRMGPDGADKDD